MTRLPINERDYYPLVVAELAERGIEAYHTYDSRRSRHGFPDFTIPVGQWLLFAELKAIGKEPTEAQWRWLHLLRGPWRASVLSCVDALDELYQLVDNMRKPGTLDSFGMPGFGGVVVLGSVRLPAEFGGGVRVGRGLQASPSAAGPTATRSRPRRPCSGRQPPGS